MSAPAMPAEKLGGLLDVLRQTDSVELKLTVPEAEQRSTIAALGIAEGARAPDAASGKDG